MPQTLKPNDDRLVWQGAVSLQRTDDWIQPWRLPFEETDLYYGALVERAAMPAGVRISFRSSTSSIVGQIEKLEGVKPIDLYVDGDMVGSAPIDNADSFKFEGLAEGEKLVELWLPQVGQFRLKSLDIDEGASVAPHVDERPKWITYGSSITHCGAAESPSFTWPAIVARGHGLNLTCLGYGGQCHLDPLVARVIRDRPADYISLSLGINIYGAGSLSERTFRTGIIAFVQTIREKQPDATIVLVSPIWSPPRETAKNSVGFTLQQMREQVAAASETLRSHGDKNIHFANGLDVFGEDLNDLMPDQLHPDAAGYKAMGANFLDVVARKHFV